MVATKFVNGIYERIRGYVKEHHGFGQDLYESPLFQEYQETMNHLKSFDGERVRIQYLVGGAYLGVTRGEKVGRVVVKDNKVMFFEGRNRTRHNLLDAGLYEGWFATLIVLQMETI